MVCCSLVIFPLCDLGMLTCCLLDNLKLMLTVVNKTLKEMLHVLASCMNSQIIRK